MSEMLEIDVVYALAQLQRVVRVRIGPDATVGDAIAASGLMREFPEIDLSAIAVGVFGRPCTLAQALHQHDRVEIYRPLQVDPKLARRLRAQQQAPRKQR